MYWCVCLFIYLQENKGIKLLKMLKKASLDPMGEVFSLLDWLDTVMTEWHMYVCIPQHAWIIILHARSKATTSVKSWFVNNSTSLNYDRVEYIFTL